MTETGSEPGADDTFVIALTDRSGTRRVSITAATTLGREVGDVIVDDPRVSGRHCRFGVVGGDLTLEDLGSSNGTFVNGHRIEMQVLLADGDVVTLGDARIVVTAPAAVEPPAVEPPPQAPTERGPETWPPGTGESIRTDAIEVRSAPKTHGAEVARSYADTATRARKALAGFGTEGWGTIPVVHLIDPYREGDEVITSGTAIDAATGQAWVIVSPEEAPEPPHRLMAVIFGAQFPSAERLSVLIEGYGLHASGVENADEQLTGGELPPIEQAEGELRAAMAVSFVRFLIEREGKESLLKLFGSPPAEVDAVVRSTYGGSLGQLETIWKNKVASGDPDVKTLDFIKLSLRYLRPYKAQQAEIFLYMLLSLAFTAAFPFVTKRLFDTALPSGEFDQVLTLLIALAVAFVISLVAGVRQAYQSATVSGAITRDLRQSIFNHVQVMPTPWFSDHPQGDVLSRLFNDVGAVQSGLSQAVGQGVFQAVSLVVSAVIMVSLNLWLGIIVLVAAPLVGFVYKSMSNGAQTRSIAVQEGSSTLLSVAAENYRANPVVKVFGLGRREERRFAEQGDRVFRSLRRMTIWSGLFGLSVNLIVTMLRLVILGLGAWLILNGRFTTGGLVAFLSIMGEVIAPVTSLVTMSQSVQASMGSLVRINEVMDHPAEPDSADLGSMPTLSREVKLTSLSMSYTPERRALDRVDATIEAGSRVAFVGPSGSGKSTVLKLLMRLHEPDEGAILVDGIDIRSGSMESWRSQLGVVFQDSFLFDATLRENIALGREGATEAEIMAAAEAAEIDTFVDSLPRGWDSLVGEGGSNLSGGQRQRVAIARALIRNPRLLVLDEATSALDPATERQINTTIEKIAGGRTVVSVTHRLTSITDYDMIFVVDEGRLVEQGSHDELLAERGVYARLWAEQTGTPLPEPEPIDIHEALQRVSFLSGLDRGALDEIVSRLTPFSLESGRTVADGDGLIIVSVGHADVVSNPDPSSMPTAHLRPGDAFGVLAAIGGSTSTWLRADGQLDLLHLSSAELTALMEQYPQIAASRSGTMQIKPPTSATMLLRSTLAIPAQTQPQEAFRTTVMRPMQAP